MGALRDPNALTPKQEAFCHAYIETSNASEAYRIAFDAHHWKPTSVVVKASVLMAKDNIRLRIGQLQGEALERHEMTVDGIAALLMDDRDFAREGEAPSAAVSATLGLAKLYGLMVDKLDHRSSDGSMTPREPRYNLVDKDDAKP